MRIRIHWPSAPQVLAFLFSVGAILGCGVARGPASRPVTGAENQVSSTAVAVKMHHQILFRHGDEQHIFDGYMLLAEDGYIVKAFAGPGIDLFTVVRAGEKSGARLHLTSLEGRMDIDAISEDIGRIYAKPCGDSAREGEISCTIRGERVTEEYDGQSRLVSRYFAKAHGVGLTIRYSDYRQNQGRDDPYRMHLKWGEGQVELIIVTGKVEAAENFDAGMLQNTLDGL